MNQIHKHHYVNGRCTLCYMPEPEPELPENLTLQDVLNAIRESDKKTARLLQAQSRSLEIAFGFSVLVLSAAALSTVIALLVLSG